MEQYSQRKWIFLGSFFAIILLYAMRIAGLQLGSTAYKERAINNALNKVTLYPGRSVLFDRNGKILVRNTPSYDLKVFPKKMGKADSLLICQILGLDSADYAERTMLAWINSKKRQRNNSYNRSAVFYSNLSPEQYAIIRENLYRLKAYYVEPKTDRLYNFNGSAHAFGYLGEVSEELLNEDPYYQPGDLVGITGLEKYYETQIRGIKGVKTVWQDRTYVEQGTVKNESFNKPAIAGPDVTLSLDMVLQLLADSLMVGKRGSIVAIEPKTGEVLAFYNSPNYNPNLLVGQQRTDEFRNLLIDPKKPLYNRAVKGVYPPGSTVKPILALIGLQEGICSPETQHSCAGGYHMGSITVGCHPHPSPLALSQSIQISCNAYYCQLFRDIIDAPKYGNVREGYAVLESYWRKFGLGSPTGIDLLGESSGNIPSVAQLDRRHGPKWRSSMIISLSIGQGEILLTPLQLANLAAIIANRGYYYTPHLVKHIEGYSDTAWNRRFQTPHYTGIEPRHFVPVIQGMEMVTQVGGTARGAGIDSVVVCAKTGTAQNPHGKDHSLFIAFAPKEDPQIAIAVIVENAGYGATYAAPIASLLMERYLHPERDTRKPYMKESMFNARLENP